MKSTVRTLCVASFLCLPLVWAGCTGTAVRESAGEYLDNTAITAKVKAELAADKMSNLFQINVETYRGIVQLSGFVNDQETAERAVTIAKKVPGVLEVKNSLIVKAQ